ncbi:hypothetical protein ACMZ5F_10575 [Streptomyces rhizosphaericola]
MTASTREYREYRVKLGVWVMNQKGRRAKLSADKLAVLAALGLDWVREG